VKIPVYRHYPGISVKGEDVLKFREFISWKFDTCWTEKHWMGIENDIIEEIHEYTSSAVSGNTL